MDYVAANHDKPHRCPRCHRIADLAREHGGARLNSTYTCSACNVRWWPGWSDNQSFTVKNEASKTIRKFGYCAERNLTNMGNRFIDWFSERI
jgi:hypothetical protein